MWLFAALGTRGVPFKAFCGINGKGFHSCPDGLLKCAVRPRRLFEFTSRRYTIERLTSCRYTAERFTSRGYPPGGIATMCRTAAERRPGQRPNDPVSHQPMTLLKQDNCA